MRRRNAVILALAVVVPAVAIVTVVTRRTEWRVAPGMGWELIHRAAHEGRVDEVRSLLDQGVNIDSPTKHSWTPLHLAAQANRIEVARLLLDRGADIEAKGWFKATPLRDAAAYGSKAVGLLLIDRGAIIDIEIAAGLGRVDLLDQLINAGPTTLPATGEAATAPRGDHPLPVHWAAMNGEIEAIEFLLNQGFDINEQDERKRSPLEVAKMKKQSETVEWLLEHGAAWDVVEPDE
jgi:ankyrin repeat protein